MCPRSRCESGSSADSRPCLVNGGNISYPGSPEQCEVKSGLANALWSGYTVDAVFYDSVAGIV